MMDSLNPQQFFHGTTHAIKDGMVRPADDVDKPVSEYSFGDPGDMSEGDHAFAIRNNETYAWHAATTFHPSQRRARVYEVGPAEDATPGPWNKAHPNFASHYWGEGSVPNHEMPKSDVETALNDPDSGQDEWASNTGFPVKNRIDIKPGHQGTFPDIAWGRFSKQPYNQRINHPSDIDIKYGHGNWGEQVHEDALKENAAVDEFREPPRRRTGAALRAYMRGEPEPPQKFATLFDGTDVAEPARKAEPKATGITVTDNPSLPLRRH